MVVERRLHLKMGNLNLASISINSVSKSFGETEVLKNVSLDVADGEFLSLLGPSGCGKSTLLRVIAGLERQNSGSIEIGENSVDTQNPRERNIAMVFQNYALYPNMTVRENVALPLLVGQLNLVERLPLLSRILPRSRSVAKAVDEQVRNTAASLNIEQLLDRRPHQLSGGQQQRVALARAIVRQPYAFLLDEPFSNLDAKLRVQLRSEIAALHHEIGETFIFVTHDQAEALTLSDRIAVMKDGVLLQVGTPQEIFDAPNSVAVAEFVGSPPINLFQASSENGVAHVSGKDTRYAVDCEVDAKLTIGIRPEHVRVIEKEDDQSAIKAKVLRVEYLGTDSYAHLTPINGNSADSEREIIARVASSSNGARPSVGDVVGIEFDASDMHVFDGQGDRIEPVANASGAQETALSPIGAERNTKKVSLWQISQK